MASEKIIHPILALSMLAIVSTALFALFFRETPPSNKELVSMVLGIMLGSLKDAYNYYFGSSRESQEKNATIAVQADTAKSIAATAAAAAGANGNGVTVDGPATIHTETTVSPNDRPKEQP